MAPTEFLPWPRTVEPSKEGNWKLVTGASLYLRPGLLERGSRRFWYPGKDPLLDSPIGLIQLRRYLQSGNAVFKSAQSSATAMETRIEKALKEDRGVDARVLVLSRGEFRGAIASNPFPQAETDPKTLHLFFLSEPPYSPDIESLNSHKADTESFEITDRVFYLHAPEGKPGGGEERTCGGGAGHASIGRHQRRRITARGAWP